MADGFRIYRDLHQIETDFGPSALTIGNFDGVHIGHQAIFRRLVQIGAENGWTPCVLTFDPHPARVVAPQRAPRLLTTPEQRAAWMRAAGVRRVLICPFSREFSQLSPEEFVENIVVARLGARAVLVGANFRFGRNHAGDTTHLKELGERHGVLTEVVAAVAFRRRLVSSSEVRRLVGAGNVAAAGRLLGRPYALEGHVVPGRGVGARLTVPTLNLEPSTEVLPAPGVYVTRTHLLEAGLCFPSVTNVGFRPTFGGGPVTVETFVLDPLPPGQQGLLRLEFLHRLRDERKFPDADSLKQRILLDVAAARRYFRRLRRWVRTPTVVQSDARI